jgi:hypothetical protein
MPGALGGGVVGMPGALGGGVVGMPGALGGGVVGMPGAEGGAGVPAGPLPVACPEAFHKRAARTKALKKRVRDVFIRIIALS